jgi:hypothetical protein
MDVYYSLRHNSVEESAKEERPWRPNHKTGFEQVLLSGS